MPRWLDACFGRMYTRRSEEACPDVLPEKVCRRLLPAFRDLTKEERALQARMGLVARPCLPLVDEEMAAIIPPERRARLEAEYGEPTGGSA